MKFKSDNTIKAKSYSVREVKEGLLRIRISPPSFLRPLMLIVLMLGH
jgi:hypothetical protein